MVKYFAKFRAVNEEMKEGDLVREPNGKVYRLGEFGEDTGFSYLYNLDGSFYDASDMFEKVKLFICTRQFRVGERIWKDLPDGSVNQLVSKFSLKQVIKNGWYKVIGEVSPEATWVKEGDKFDAEDLFANGCGHNWNDIPTNIWKFKIKGPCGYYH